MKGITISTNNAKFFEQTDGLSSYLKSIRKYDALSAEEEQNLFKRYKQGDLEARNEIILRNQRFVFSIAKRYSRDSDEIIDYVNEGNFGLFEAIDEFNPDLGWKFITFAVNYIRREMNRYMTEKRFTIKKSNAMKYAKKVDKITQRFYTINGRMPDINEVADELERQGDEIKDISDLYDLTITSINENIDNDDSTIEDCQLFNDKTSSYNDCEEIIENEYDKSIANKILAITPDKYSTIIKKLYGIGYDREYTNVELADEYDMSLEDFNKLVDNILAYMKQEYMEQCERKSQ